MAISSSHFEHFQIRAPFSQARSGSWAAAVWSWPGSIGAPVAVGGLVVAAGDVLVGDADGVVVVPRGRVKEVVDAVGGIVEKEEALRRRILAARPDHVAVAR